MRNRGRAGDPVVSFVLLLALLALAVLTSCSPTAPDPPAPPPANVVNITIPGNPTCVIVNGNGCNNGTPPSPATGPFAKPDYVKITQFGESCPPSVAAGPSGQDRSVRVGCSKALTLSPKCRQLNGPDIDCPVPEGAAPDSFEVTAGGEHIVFSLSEASRFNRNADGVSPGSVTITGAYAGVRAQADFILTVVP